jgi:hypothetical protein
MIWVRRIQELASQKLSTEKIARHLNEEDHETKRAGKWSRTAVWRTLQQLKKKAVTKSFRNGNAKAKVLKNARRAATFISASKRDPFSDANISPTEKHVRPTTGFSKPYKSTISRKFSRTWIRTMTATSKG